MGQQDVTTGDTTKSERPPRKWWRFRAGACRRKPWEKSDADCVRRRFLDVFRWGFYFASFLIIAILIGALGIFLFGNNFWEEFRLWVDNNGFLFANYLYFMYAVFLLTAVIHFGGTFERAKYLPRIQDRHDIQSLLDSGKHVPLETNKPEGCSEQGLRSVVEKLQKNLDNDESIVEYDLLHLKILLVNCASEEKVKHLAGVHLGELEEYADEEAHTQTKEDYWDIRHQIESLKEKLSANDDSPEREQAESSETEHHAVKRHRPSVLRELRAVITERLLPTVTENEKLWVEGTAMVDMLRYTCFVVIPLLLAAGTVPSYAGEWPFTALHWAILGAAGALVSVLRALGRADRLEVGNQLGSREIQRTWRGAGLGLVTGFLTYMLAESNFVSCYLMQNCDLSSSGSHHRYVLLAFFSGFAFERTLDRVRAATGA